MVQTVNLCFQLWMENMPRVTYKGTQIEHTAVQLIMEQVPLLIVQCAWKLNVSYVVSFMLL